MRSWIVQWLLSTNVQFRLLLNRVGGIPLFFFAIAGAALMYSVLQRRKLSPAPAGSNQAQRETGSRTGNGTRTTTPLLDSVRRVTIGLDISIPRVFSVTECVADTDGGGVGKVVTLDANVIPALGKLVKQYDVYFIIRVDDDDTEQQIQKQINASGLFKEGLNPVKVIFCETVIGRVSAVRQLEPHLHVDSDMTVINDLQRFIRHLAFLDAEDSSRNENAPNVRHTSLEKLTSGLGKKEEGM